MDKGNFDKEIPHTQASEIDGNTFSYLNDGLPSPEEEERRDAYRKREQEHQSQERDQYQITASAEWLPYPTEGRQYFWSLIPTKEMEKERVVICWRRDIEGIGRKGMFQIIHKGLV